EQAIATARRLDKLGCPSRFAEIAHYHCELALDALLDQDTERARAQLEQARAANRKSARAVQLRGDLEAQLGYTERAIAAWPTAWGGQNLRDILTTLGHDVDLPWRELPQSVRDWLLFTDEQPVVPVYPGYDKDQVKRALKRQEPPDYMGTFMSAKRYVHHTLATSHSEMMKKRVSRHMVNAECPLCEGKRLGREALGVTFAGYDIAEISRLPVTRLAEILAPTAMGQSTDDDEAPEKILVASRIAQEMRQRITALIELGLGYLSLERSTPTLSPGELQRMRLATQIHANLFGVVYVLDEPSAGLHPADTEALLVALDQLTRAGNSLFVVEHELDLIRHADWIVDVGPDAGEQGGCVLYSGPLEGLRAVSESHTRKHLFGDGTRRPRRTPRQPSGWLTLSGVTRNNLDHLDVAFPLGVFTTVTGVSGSGKSSLVSQALVELVAAHVGHELPPEEEGEALEHGAIVATGGRISSGADAIKRLVRVDQKPIGRTPRSNLATYTGLFDHVRKLFAATPEARAKKFDAGRFSFNVAKGRCPNCEGEGFVSVELLFMPSVYAPCRTCHGSRYNPETLAITYRGKTIADVLGLTVDAACEFFASDPAVMRALTVLRDVGLGYLRLGQPATELSGGEAQRIKLATELQRLQRGDSLYVLDEPTTGLHPSDVDKLLVQLDRLVSAGNTVIVVEHDMAVIAESDWVMDMGPGAGAEGGRVVAEGPPEQLARARGSRTAPYMARFLEG
ncbi:MAG: excinuclease ABC subunit A, partial [Candidatus Sericytochromatia bacterium]